MFKIADVTTQQCMSEKQNDWLRKSETQILWSNANEKEEMFKREDVTRQWWRFTWLLQLIVQCGTHKVCIVPYYWLLSKNIQRHSTDVDISWIKYCGIILEDNVDH